MSEHVGYPVTDQELRSLGFTPHALQVVRASVELPGGLGCDWMTLGDVPASPGLYAFTVDDGTLQHVTYVGRTAHLWMVTKGRLPASGGARGGQRYGRPRHAGMTRQRINILATAEIAAGRRVRHRVRPLDEMKLAVEEEALIRRWKLRDIGWNLG